MACARGSGRKEHQVFVTSSCFASNPDEQPHGPSFRRTRCIAFPAAAEPVPVRRVHAAVASALGVPPADLRLTTAAGRCLPPRLAMEAGGHSFLSAGLRLLGGKGGFGSMLRAQGGRMASQKTTNFEACRDLSGRRLKTVNEAKKYVLADYLEKEPERQKAREEKIMQKIQKGLREPSLKKRRFEDPKFFEETEGMGEEASDAVFQELGALAGAVVVLCAEPAEKEEDRRKLVQARVRARGAAGNEDEEKANTADEEDEDEANASDEEESEG
ncbi:MAG: telomere stability and silencing-domain-containing protein [Olpidium bornovanus]|uniref:Telomere stability and silencing-domain-containing protein n=1 Tax=Olpidium bornovanus TaxID=278681 RepID=A0A8H8DFM1_9FUNG|nr:MAG: telomere stability and silencing-domain-containing protein [Olpidium bornovanus]